MNCYMSIYIVSVWFSLLGTYLTFGLNPMMIAFGIHSFLTWAFLLMGSVLEGKEP